MVDRGVPRHGYEALCDGQPCGEVTSGIYSPTLDAFVGMAYLPSPQAGVGATFDVSIRGRAHRAVVVRRPLYTPAYRR